MFQDLHQEYFLAFTFRIDDHNLQQLSDQQLLANKGLSKLKPHRQINRSTPSKLGRR